MWVRRRLDIGWGELLYARLRCALPASERDRARARARIEAPWTGDTQALVCLSVRTGFDLLLRALDLPKGSEVLMSAINVPGMFRLVAAHGLTPIPLDIDGDSLRPSADQMRRAITPRTRMVVVAHLFGTRLDLSDLRTLAEQHGLLVVEDLAQAFDGVPSALPPGCDVALWSFGPIKRATALGGAVAAVRDPALADRMRGIEAGYAMQSRWRYLLRVVKYAGLKVVSYRLPFRAFVKCLTLTGHDHDAWLQRRVRSFDDASFPDALRRRPCAPLLALLNLRLRRFDVGAAARQRERGERLASLLRDVCQVIGCNAAFHGFDLFAIRVDRPQCVIAGLRRHGFDAGMRGSLVVCSTGRAGPEPERARRLLDEMVFLPLYRAMPEREVERLAALATGLGLATRDRTAR